MFFKFGAYSEMVSITVLPNASRWSSQVNPGRSLYGAYCTKHDITCFPGGATEGSVKLGITISMYGRREKFPYFASSYARSMYSTLGEIESAPRKCAPSPGKHLNSGSPSRARFTFPDDPRYLYRRTSCKNSGGNSLGSKNFSNVRCGSTLDETTFAVSSSPLCSATPHARPSLTVIFATLALVRISTPASRAAAAIALEIAPVPPRLNPHDRNAPSISPI